MIPIGPLSPMTMKEKVLFRSSLIPVAFSFVLLAIMIALGISLVKMDLIPHYAAYLIGFGGTIPVAITGIFSIGIHIFIQARREARAQALLPPPGGAP